MATRTFGGGGTLQIRVRARSDTKVTASNVKFNDFLLLDSMLKSSRSRSVPVSTLHAGTFLRRIPASGEIRQISMATGPET